MWSMVRYLAGKRGAIRLGWSLVLAGVLVAAGVTVLMAWVSPKGWVLPVHRSLDWFRGNWPSATVITTAAAVAGLLVPFVIRWLDRRRPKGTVTQAQDAQQRLVMLQRVRYKWISGVLEPSLADAARLALGLERRPEVLDLGARAVRRPGHPRQLLPDAASIGQVFDQVGGGLMILGAPGAGKTTVLLQLADVLLDRAEHDAALPIPVVVNLASWARQRRPLAVWLADEVAEVYKVPRRLTTAWIEQDALALLLDGLDEVAEAHRIACAAEVPPLSRRLPELVHWTRSKEEARRWQHHAGTHWS